jgi:hypothetical protein
MPRALADPVQHVLPVVPAAADAPVPVAVERLLLCRVAELMKKRRKKKTTRKSMRTLTCRMRKKRRDMTRKSMIMKRKKRS